MTIEIRYQFILHEVINNSWPIRLQQICIFQIERSLKVQKFNNSSIPNTRHKKHAISNNLPICCQLKPLIPTTQQISNRVNKNSSLTIPNPQCISLMNLQILIFHWLRNILTISYYFWKHLKCYLYLDVLWLSLFLIHYLSIINCLDIKNNDINL